MKTIVRSSELLLLPMLLFFFCRAGIQAQNKPVSPQKLYDTWIYPNKEFKGQHLVLFDLKDSAVILSDSRSKYDYNKGDYSLSKVDIKNISVMKVRRKGAGAAIAIGGITGAALGGIILVSCINAQPKPEGLEQLFRPTVPVTGIIAFIVSTAVGFGTGILLSSPVKFNLHRSQANYENNKQTLNEYAIMGTGYLKNISGATFSILPDSVSDIDGNYYHTLALGGQVWMAGDLKVSRYRNGDTIIEMKENSEWGKSVYPSTCWYMNHNPGSRMSGRLYNYNAVADSRGLCPKGWHVPSMPEWESLVACLGGSTEAGRKLSSGIVNGTGGGTGASVLSNPFALPGGFRFQTGEFSSTKAPSCQWWSSTRQDPALSKTIQLGNDDSGIFFTGSDTRSGLSVRCLRD